MAWGRSTPKPPPPPRSAFMYLACWTIQDAKANMRPRKSLPLLISKSASEKMEKKNVVFTKDGVKVGVKQLKNENYVDTTQSFLVKAWNLSTWPGYKSKLWNQEQQGKVESRKPFSRSSSSNVSTKSK
ncbi:hypothetical protein M7I_6440 [Glarea lozoyensis 74030]|uniref:Uncharacterized protein n=1 Tax=Glarea lozoyensis (strain ATCC 74030 / MF5533) TaxID=1104152 RepID=H0EUK3_GLAL7|nr:hypothetical protein M7I_6440 [Glarea lozoyensis 74030]